MVTEKELMLLSRYEYVCTYPKQGKEFLKKNAEDMPRGIKLLARTNMDKAEFENHGLQASLYEVNGQKVMVFRGSEGFNSVNGRKDWFQDFLLNDPNANRYEDGQFSDYKRWIQRLVSEGFVAESDLKKIIYTGHSLGGALATAAAVEFDGKGVVFSSPNPYNALSEIGKIKVGSANVVNYVQATDMIPTLPRGLPQIGEKVYASYEDPEQDKQLKEKLVMWVGAGGHEPTTFRFNSDGTLKRAKSQQISTGLMTYVASTRIVSRIGDLGVILALAQKVDQVVARWTMHPGTILTDIGLVASHQIMSSALDNLTTIEKQNLSLFDKMTTIYQDTLLETYLAWGWAVDYGQLEALAYEFRMHPVHCVSEMTLDQVGREAHFQREKLEELVGKVVARTEAEQAFDAGYQFG
jgi:hypothetical protein